jgi:hypothetical protein
MYYYLYITRGTYHLIKKAKKKTLLEIEYIVN